MSLCSEMMTVPPSEPTDHKIKDPAGEAKSEQAEKHQSKDW